MPCAATAATSPVKPSVSGTAPAATTPGRTLKVTTTLKSAKTRTIRVGLVLATGTKAKGGLALGTGKRVRVRAGRRVRLAVPGKIAAGTLDDGVRRLLVCVDPAKAVLGTAPTGSCAVVRGAVGASALPDPVSLIDAALGARRISAVQSRQYRLWAVVNSSKLPKVYRGKRVESTHAVISDLANNAGKLPAAARAEAVRYFLPPTATGNAWIGKPRARALAEDPLACKGFGQLEPVADSRSTTSTSAAGTRSSAPTTERSSGYLKWTAKPPANAFRTQEAAENTAKGRTSAIKYALAFPKIWNTLTPLFGVPKSDAAENCYHGPDGRYDIYVDVDYGGIAASGPAGAIALTLPYPALGNYPIPGKWCSRPAFTVIYPGLDNFVLAHEFMHALQFAHRYKTCDEPIAFWDEGGANFAADIVYPDSQYEQRTADSLLTHPTWFSSPRTAKYDYWPFWMMLQRENGGVRHPEQRLRAAGLEAGDRRRRCGDPRRLRETDSAAGSGGLEPDAHRGARLPRHEGVPPVGPVGRQTPCAAGEREPRPGAAGPLHAARVLGPVRRDDRPDLGRCLPRCHDQGHDGQGAEVHQRPRRPARPRRRDDPYRRRPVAARGLDHQARGGAVPRQPGRERRPGHPRVVERLEDREAAAGLPPP